MAPASKRKRSEEFPLSREDGTQQPSQSALLRNTEEVSFPRGGASVLTPLELKQVANEAAKDVLFGTENKDVVKPLKKKKKITKGKQNDKKGSKKNGDADIDEDEDEKISVLQHISFRNLKVGSYLIGQISQISKTDIRVSFTDDISGYINLTHISDQFTTILEDLDENMNSDDEDQEYEKEEVESENEIPDLNKYFQLGQWLRCKIIANTALETKTKQNKKKRIELTIEPSYVNTMIEEDLVKNNIVQCSVKSIEDHGAQLDLGIVGITGFISKRDVPNFDSLLPGSVFLANIVKKTDRVINVNLDFNNKKSKVTQISSVDAILPGQSVDLLCMQHISSGIIGKCFGLVPGFIAGSHLNTFEKDDLKHKFAISSNIQARILGVLLDNSNEKCLILSTLPHITTLENKTSQADALEAFPIGYIFETTKVKGRDSDFLYLALTDDCTGRVHKSKIGELEKTDDLPARVTGYDLVDRFYELATDPTILKLKYTRSQDIEIGELLVGCEITSVSSSGIDLKIFNGQFTAKVPALHISDTRLVYPERKYKIGSKVKARVLNVDSRGRISATMKKTLVNIEENEIPIVNSYEKAIEIKEANEKTLATVQSFRPNGAILAFFGGLTAFLPNAEISEVFVNKPEQHLRLGQSVVVKFLKVDAENHRILATCKVSNAQAQEQKTAIANMILGRTIVSVSVVEKTKDSLIVEATDSGLRGIIHVGHLSDDRIEKNRADFKKIKVGSELTGLVIDKVERTQVFNVTLKKSLIDAANNGSLPTEYDEVKSVSKTTPLVAYIKSISDKGLFVAFNGSFVGLVLPSYAVENRNIDINKTFYVNQSVTAYLLRNDDDNERFLLTLKKPVTETKKPSHESVDLVNPVDASVKSIEDLALGKLLKVKVKAIKKNQLNVIIADNIHGRVDASEAFDKIDGISDKKAPLSAFKKDSIINAKIIGFHDIKSHKYLPITHHVAKASVFELTIAPSKLKDQSNSILSVKDVKVDDEVTGFVNNFSNNHLWLTVSPLLNARLSLFDLTEDGLKLSQNIEDDFPLGSALSLKITSIDTEHGIVNVIAKSHVNKTYSTIKVGEELPARVAKIFTKYVLLDLGNDVTAISFATEALDDFSVSLKDAFTNKINHIIPSKVLTVDSEAKRITVSLRSDNSKTISSASDIKQGDIVNALVKAVTDKGIFVFLSSSVEAFVPISKLSDSYLKDWKKFFKPMQNVVGKVVQCDSDDKILITLRESEINGELKVLKTYEDIKAGDTFNGSVKSVTDFGVFVKLDKTANCSGLAHITEIAETKPSDLSALFGPGDRVKAYVLKVNKKKQQLSLSLKASHFTNDESKDDENSIPVEKTFEDGPVEENVDFDMAESDNESDIEEAAEQEPKSLISMSTDGLSLSTDFDWTASILDQAQEEEDEEEEDVDFTEGKKHKHKKRSKITEDKTVDINTRAPESVGDFERLIIGNPNSSVVWMNYMAFQLQLSEVEKAREIAERALKTINFREEAEKLNIWIAMLNLENTFGTSESLDELFKRACQYMDSFTIHNKLLSIYQMSEKIDSAKELFKITAKKFGSEKVSIWISWGDFLISNNEEEEARSILASALKSLPKRNHIEIVRKFAQLEYTKGDTERGRSLFEGLLADAPKRIDLWNVYIDQEIKANEKKKVEDLFERVISKKITKKQAKFFFNKWLQFEEAKDDTKMTDYVKAKATEFVASQNKSEEAD